PHTTTVVSLAVRVGDGGHRESFRSLRLRVEPVIQGEDGLTWESGHPCRESDELHGSLCTRIFGRTCVRPTVRAHPAVAMRQRATPFLSPRGGGRRTVPPARAPPAASAPG